MKNTTQLNIKACLDGMILSAWQNHTWFDFVMYDFSV